MARLRMRLELSRGGLGVPLHKLCSVITESQNFLHLLADDVGIDRRKGEWLVFDFDRESLDFTAEFVGPVSARQVEAFNAAFAGATSVRGNTIAQFARIADGIGEDEVVGFGLYHSDEQAEPAEWRCLSRRDALRITEEIQVLLGVSEELDFKSRLPAVRDPALAERMFGDRRDKSLDHTRWTDYIREVESKLSTRISRVENKLEEQSSELDGLRDQTDSAEKSFRKLLTTIEGFCGEATRQLERASPPADVPRLMPAPDPVHRLRWGRVAAAAAAILVLFVAGLWLWPSRSPSIAANPSAVSPAVEKAASPPPKPLPSKPAIMRVEIEANEPAWVSITDITGKKLLNQLQVPGSVRVLELDTAATLRTGNAAGLMIRLNGKSIGEIGPPGQIRDVVFKDGSFRIASPR